MCAIRIISQVDLLTFQLNLLSLDYHTLTLTVVHFSIGCRSQRCPLPLEANHWTVHYTTATLHHICLGHSKGLNTPTCPIWWNTLCMLDDFPCAPYFFTMENSDRWTWIRTWPERKIYDRLSEPHNRAAPANLPAFRIGTVCWKSWWYVFDPAFHDVISEDKHETFRLDNKLCWAVGSLQRGVAPSSRSFVIVSHRHPPSSGELSISNWVYSTMLSDTLNYFFSINRVR